MRTVHWLFAVSVLLFVTSIWFLVVGARNAQGKSAGSAPVASVKQIMNGIIVPASNAIYSAVSTSVTAAGIEEVAPQNDAEWEALGANAAALVEAGNLLLVEDRAKDSGEWATQSRAMVDGATKALKATDERKPDGILDAGEAINNSCDACHQKYQ